MLGEGVSLLVKYALGLDPTVRANPADLPDFSNWTEGMAEYLAVRVVRDPTAEDVTITAEISDDLETWSASEVILIEETDSVQHFRDSKPLGENDRRFLRLRFSPPPEE